VYILISNISIEPRRATGKWADRTEPL